MSEKELYDEKVLLLRVAAGDETAFGELFNTYYQALGYYIYRITKSHELAQEIVQDVFMKMWMSREALESVRNFKSYLFIISKNMAISHLRKIASERVKQQDYKREIVTNEATILEEQQLREHRLSLIDMAIAQLPPQQRKVYLLSRRDKFTYMEIAGQLGVSRETIKSHLQVAIASIIKFIRAHPEATLWVAWLFFTKK